MAPCRIIDSHVHLWPESAANSDAHAWMKEGDMLAKQHLLQDYRHAAKQEVKDDSTPTVRGVVYIETDRRLEDKTGRELHEWAHQPTEEIKFLRSIVENRDAQRDADMLLGIVLWAPMRSDKRTFSDWFSHAEQTACPETWRRVKGFRFLLQDITDRQTFEGISLGTSVIANLKSLLMSGRRYSFDVGVDAHSAGVWQLEYFATIIERVHARVSYEFHKVMFILNHLCKPDLTQAPEVTSVEDFDRWCACIKRFSEFPRVYMKLSGAFSELSSERVTTTSAAEIAEKLKPWLDHIFECFKPDRIMFGSDWPVCNVRGPAGEDSWTLWKDVVSITLDRRNLSDYEKERVWYETANEAYRLHADCPRRCIADHKVAHEGTLG